MPPGGVHLGFALLASKLGFLRNEHFRVGFFVGSILPDVDLLLIGFVWMLWGEAAAMATHRTFTHAYPLYILVYILSYLLPQQQKQQKQKQQQQTNGNVAVNPAAKILLTNGAQPPQLVTQLFKGAHVPQVLRGICVAAVFHITFDLFWWAGVRCWFFIPGYSHKIYTYGPLVLDRLTNESQKLWAAFDGCAAFPSFYLPFAISEKGLVPRKGSARKGSARKGSARKGSARTLNGQNTPWTKMDIYYAIGGVQMVYSFVFVALAVEPIATFFLGKVNFTNELISFVVVYYIGGMIFEAAHLLAPVYLAPDIRKLRPFALFDTSGPPREHRS